MTPGGIFVSYLVAWLAGMVFRVQAEDLLGRVGRLRTPSGWVETPAYLPVINPVSQEIPASWMRERLGAEIVITNAYIILRRLKERALREGVHGILGYDGAVMTDSGGYQVLEYGGVEASPAEVAALEEEMGSDIAVPLDVPTGLLGREEALETVEQTLRNLEETVKTLEERGRRRALWAAPIQGGTHLDLIEMCVRREEEMGFDLYALGSPTPLMEGYRYDKLFRMLFTARKAIGPGKPLHLFGAGHPSMFAFAVALGADLFDSAAYYLYAKDGRYMTSSGTLRIERMDYLPCECPICSKTDLRELKELPGDVRTRLIAMHNLYVCFREVREIRQAIRDGRLMELLEQRARSHPSLYQGFLEIMGDEDILDLMERHTPLSARRGVNLYDEVSLGRPRVRRARRRLMELFSKPREGERLVLIPATMKVSWSKLAEALGEGFEAALYGTPYGLVPLELRYTYPFSQTNHPKSLIEENLNELVELAVRQVEGRGYREVIVLEAKSRVLRRFGGRLAQEMESRGLKVELKALR